MGLNDGARYDAATDTWTPITTTNAPKPRFLHTAVWTGREMLVWGGAYSSSPWGGGYFLNDGGRYLAIQTLYLPLSLRSEP